MISRVVSHWTDQLRDRSRCCKGAALALIIANEVRGIIFVAPLALAWLHAGTLLPPFLLH